MALKRNRSEKLLQPKKHRNRVALKTLRRLGFSLPLIRKALMDLNEIQLVDVARGQGITTVTVSRTVSGMKVNPVAKEGLAKNLNVSVHELFPEE